MDESDRKILRACLEHLTQRGLFCCIDVDGEFQVREEPPDESDLLVDSIEVIETRPLFAHEYFNELISSVAYEIKERMTKS